MMTGYSPSNLLSQLVGNSLSLSAVRSAPLKQTMSQLVPTRFLTFFQTYSLTKVSSSFLKHIVSRIVLNQFKPSLKLGRDPIYLRTPVTKDLSLLNPKSICQPDPKPVQNSSHRDRDSFQASHSKTGRFGRDPGASRGAGRGAGMEATRYSEHEPRMEQARYNHEASR